MANYLDQTGLSYFWQQLKTKLAAKANLASPTFTGTPAAPTASAGTNTTQIATTAFVNTAIQDQEILDEASGKLVNVQNAKAGSQIKELTLLNSGGTELTGKTVAITNKNLFRIDLLASSSTNKGVTFTKGSDGGITASGTTTGTYASTTCNIDKNALVPGIVYALSCGNGGTVYAQLAITYTDNTTQYLAASTSYTVFMVPKAVQSVVGSVQITNSGVSVNATVYPQLEVSGVATDFVNNTYTTYTTGALPTLPATVSNVYSTDDTVATIEMTYVTDMTDALKKTSEKTDTLAMVKVDSNMGPDEANKTVYTDGTGTVATRKLTEGYTIVNSLPTTGIDENTVYLISTNFDPSSYTPITYTLSRSGSTITLTGSNGSITSVNGGLTTSEVEALIDTTINNVLGVSY